MHPLEFCSPDSSSSSTLSLFGSMQGGQAFHQVCSEELLFAPLLWKIRLRQTLRLPTFMATVVF